MTTTKTQPRKATLTRKTLETQVHIALAIDGSGTSDVSTGLGFLDHMLATLAQHTMLDLTLTCIGDLRVDDHHTVEDCALALGAALDEALGDRSGIARFGSALAPMDEALARAVVDLSGRAAHAVDLALTRERVGDVSCENMEHFFVSLAGTLRAAVHVDVLRGRNDHHKIEAAFKGLALALRCAIARTGACDIPSVKGVL